jgi:two-component system OmpR family sensor kinase
VLQRLSLRARLLIGVLGLAGIGLAVADLVTYHEIRNFLFQRTDTSLTAAHHALEAAGGAPGTLSTLEAAVPGYYIEIRTPSGVLIGHSAFHGGPHGPEDATAPPDLPARLTLTPPESGGPEATRYFTVGTLDGNGRYRVRASLAPGAQAMLVVAEPLRSVDATLHRLFVIELVTTLIAVAAIGGLALYVVRLSLRPLDGIEETAAAIGAGDLSRRVDIADEKTEVGRLGLALNAMLGQIEAAFKAREASESRLRRFVADASHELRTPLSAVRAYAELFKRGAASRPADLERSMDGISRESERMSVLVEDLLLLARLDEGRPLEREPVQLDEVAREAVETARTVDPERPLEVELEPARVLGDRDRLRQIVDNLLANVRAHTPAGAPARVAVRRVDGSAELEVDDSGPGMEQAEVDQVFERFFRADPSRARASGGVGLGLAIVAAVAEAHGGTVSAESKPGEGATFRVRVPLDADS